MQIPGLGNVSQHERFDEWLISGPISVPVLFGQTCQFTLEGYAGDGRKEDFHEAIARFLAADETVLKACEQDVYNYYKLVNDGCWEPSDEEWLSIAEPSRVWDYVQLGSSPSVQRNSEDDLVYVALESECEWEPEHGLMIVFKNGSHVTKVSEYDGHLT